MGCTNSKKCSNPDEAISTTPRTFRYPQHPGVRPAEHMQARVPTPPEIRERELRRQRQPFSDRVNHPQQRFVETIEIADGFFHSTVTNTPSRQPGFRVAPIRELRTFPSRELRRLPSRELMRMSSREVFTDARRPPPLPRLPRTSAQPIQHNETSPEQQYPPGTAVPYVPPNQLTPSPPHPSSSDSKPHPTTPNPQPCTNSFRSYSGRMMYSPSRFAANSSPYGTPSIRVVPSSMTDVRAESSQVAAGDDTARNMEHRDDGAATKDSVVADRKELGGHVEGAGGAFSTDNKELPADVKEAENSIIDVNKLEGDVKGAATDAIPKEHSVEDDEKADEHTAKSDGVDRHDWASK